MRPRTDRQTHRRAWPQYISRHLRLTRNVNRVHVTLLLVSVKRRSACMSCQPVTNHYVPSYPAISQPGRAQRNGRHNQEEPFCATLRLLSAWLTEWKPKKASPHTEANSARRHYFHVNVWSQESGRQCKELEHLEIENNTRFSDCELHIMMLFHFFSFWDSC